MTRFPPARPRKAPKVAPKQLAPIRTHVFVASGRFAPSAKENDPAMEICGREDCMLLRKTRIHAVPELPEHVATDEARRLGEGGAA